MHQTQQVSGTVKQNAVPTHAPDSAEPSSHDMHLACHSTICVTNMWVILYYLPWVILYYLSWLIMYYPHGSYSTICVTNMWVILYSVMGHTVLSV